MARINQKIIIIAGPTASGKSDLALRLAKLAQGKLFQKKHGVVGAEIISADSRQVYRGLDIGTGKVSKKEQRLVPHHLLDVSSPKRVFTVAQFQKLGRQAIKDILKRNKLPIIVGGTGQYIDTLVYNIALPEVPPNRKLRAKLQKQSTEQLFAQLQKLDPERARNIDRHNPRRLIRALEIIFGTGKAVPKQELRITTEIPGFAREPYPRNYELLWLGINPMDLEKRISKRLAQRFRQGMIGEVKKLYANGVSWQRIHDLGLEYRWVGQYLQNKISKDEMHSGLEQAIRQYAKRQMTWFKRNKEIQWIKTFGEAQKIMKAFV